MRKFKSLLTKCVVLSLVLCLCACQSTAQNPEIREKYPLITESQFSLDVASFTFEELVVASPDIVEISVVEILPDYTVDFKDEANGVNSELLFHQCKVKVINNLSETALNLAEDDTITICCNSRFDGSYPELAVGMNAICSLEAAKGSHTGKYIFYNKGFYYIDEGLALAAYEGDKSPAAISCDKNTLVEKITSIRNNKAR